MAFPDSSTTVSEPHMYTPLSEQYHAKHLLAPNRTYGLDEDGVDGAGALRGVLLPRVVGVRLFEAGGVARGLNERDRLARVAGLGCGRDADDDVTAGA